MGGLATARQVSNPAGQAIKNMSHRMVALIFYRLSDRVAPVVTARKSRAFSCGGMTKSFLRQVPNPAWIRYQYLRQTQKSHHRWLFSFIVSSIGLYCLRRQNRSTISFAWIQPRSTTNTHRILQIIYRQNYNTRDNHNNTNHTV